MALTRLAARGDLSQLRWARWQSARSLDAHPPPRVRRGPWLYVRASACSLMPRAPMTLRMVSIPGLLSPDRAL